MSFLMDHEKRGTLISAAPLFRTEFLQIFIGAFLVVLDISAVNILNSIISRPMGSQRQYLELLVSFRLSLRRTAVFIRFYLFIPKRDDVEELRTSDKL